MMGEVCLDHPSQKPIQLIGELIVRYSEVNDLIFDPFVGSGTTLVAAKQLGRRYLGMEIEPKYVEIAKKRLAETGISTKEERIGSGVPLTFEDILED